MAAAQLHIQTLGRFRARREEEPIPDKAWGTHRAKILFKLLLTQAGQPLLKDQIMEWLWPEATLKAATQALYTAVSDLRRVLEPDLARRADSTFILSTDDGYQFNLDSPHSLDKTLFEQQVTLARHHAQQNALEAAVQAYAQAEALYAGDYLPDDLYAEWSLGERERLRALLLASLMEAAEAQAQLGRYRQAVANCRRVLTMDNCQEEVYRALMLYHYAAGDQAQALRAYAECETALQRELEVQPMAATQALAEQIKTRQVAGVDDRPAPPVPLPATTPTEMRYSLSQMPFVGRAAEQAQMHRLWAAAMAGEGGLLLVVGEAGVGKSTLVAQALDGNNGCAAGRGDAHELTQGLPYHPLADVIWQAWRDGRLPTSTQSWLAQIARLVPEVGSVEAIAGPPPPGGEDKTHLFDALRHCFLSLDGAEETSGYIIVLEDLQWADEGTLEFLAYLAPYLGRSPVLVVATCRRADRLKPLLRRAGRDPWLHALQLRPLTEAETVELVVRLAAQSSAVGAFGHRLYKATGGNPLFAAGVLARLFETGQLWSDAEGRWQGIPQLLAAPVLPVPDEVEELVARRMQALSPVATRLLNIVAVADGADAALLQTVYGDAEAGLSEAALLDALDELLESDLLGATPEGVFQFHNEALREAAYGRLNAARRQRLHTAVGAALEQRVASAGRRPDEWHGLIGEHFLHGEVWDKAVDYLLKAGDSAAKLYTFQEARRHYERVLACLSRLPDSEDNRRRHVDALLQYDNVAFRGETLERNQARLAEAERLARTLPGLDGPRRLARVHLALGRLASIRNDHLAALDYFQLAFAAAQALQDEEQAAITTAAMGIVACQQGRFGEASQLLARALAPLERVGDWTFWLLAVIYHAIALAARGYGTAAVAAEQRAIARAQAINYLTHIALTQSYLCVVHFLAGDWANALNVGQAAIEAAQRSSDLLSACIVHQFMAWGEVRQGEPEAAQRHLAQAAALSQRFGVSPVFANWFAAAEAERTLLFGDPAEALRLARQAVHQAQRAGDIFAEGLAQRTWGQALWKTEGGMTQPFETTEARLAESLRLLELAEARLEAARTQAAWGLLCRDHQDDAAARHHFEQAIAQFETSGLADELAQTRRWLAELNR